LGPASGLFFGERSAVTDRKGMNSDYIASQDILMQNNHQHHYQQRV
jgi:hypothetical protein